MVSHLKVDPHKLLIFHELRKRRIYVGALRYDTQKDLYELSYDQHYLNASNAIPLGPRLKLFQRVHTSEKGLLFPEFLDRIPERANPAYQDYCHSEGISVDETNPIILLGTIGKRGPSTFVFEAVYKKDFSIKDLIALRQTLAITQHDVAMAFDIPLITLQRIESQKSQDPNTLQLLEIYFTFPDVALWQLRRAGAKAHRAVRAKLVQYFEQKLPTD